LFSAAEEREFDVVVVGGGITGAGVARSAAARGLSVALIEARDIASGTSSRSSKLIHGGVRYLAQGAISLVRETARERQVLRTVAPHLARVAPILIPTRSATEMAKYRVGVALFERLGKVPREERHEVWDARQIAEHEPAAAVDGVTGAVRYYEFLTDDARLTLANARSAAADGALVLTYAPVTEILKEDGRAFGVRCESALPGEALHAGSRVALTKGIHLVVPHSRLPIMHTVVFEASDRRPVVAVPRGDVTYLGTTDTFHADAEYWPAIEQEEVDYLLAATARTFNTDPLSVDDVVSSWTGIRPLVAQPGKKPAEISRRDEVWTGPAGVLSIAGGKLTAYRPMAERVVDMVGKTLGQSTRPGDTDRRVLVGGDCEPAELAVERNEGSASWRRLVDLYGAEARAVDDDGGDVAAEVRHAVRNEGALRLEDYWVRRSARALYDLDAGLSTLDTASGEMAKLLGWTEGRRLDEVSECRARHARDNALFNGT